MSPIYERFWIERPDHLADDYWNCIECEANRLWRSLEAGDASQAIGDIKCLVESIARIVHDINGTPVGSDAPFQSVLSKAHKLLADQPGRELVNESPFGDMATQARKIAGNLREIRNEYGGGHGRARTPELKDEMVSLALDGGLLWSRWALRRIGYFAEGRPEQLIDDLVGRSRIFRAGDLRRRLEAANLPRLEPRHQRAIGVAVGQRVARGTFVVGWDGLEPCLESDSLITWTRDYRLGLVQGLWFEEDPRDRVTMSKESIEQGLRILDPIPDCADELAGWVCRIKRAGYPPNLEGDRPGAFEVANFIRERIENRPPEERGPLTELADHLDRGPF